jgi:hypothetical protein
MAPIADKVVAMPSRQLLASRFGSESKFEGQLVGTLERVENDGAMRVLRALFVAREPEPASSPRSR